MLHSLAKENASDAPTTKAAKAIQAGIVLVLLTQ